MRPPLPPAVTDRIRRERCAPHPSQHDYMHLRDLRAALRRTFDTIDVKEGPALDLYCGSRPYESLLPSRPVWGFDIDRHFGGADVVGGMPLPFRDGAFALVLCTQALYLVDDAAATVSEMRRVTAVGGHAVITLPFILRRESPTERRYSPEALAHLLRDWDDVAVTKLGTAASGAALCAGQIAAGAARRWPVTKPFLPGIALLLNACGVVAEMVLGTFLERWPASALIVARRPRD